MGFLSKIKESMLGDSSEVMKETEEDEYVELGAKEGAPESNVIVKPYILHDFESIKPILEELREGKTIALVNIKPLKDKDLVELKRAINKLKKTCDAIEGDIAGFGEDWIAVVPSFAKIHRVKKEDIEEPKKKAEEVTEYSSEEPVPEVVPDDDGEHKIETY
ncbi:MAG: cell division protein SepF [Nanoarchaeota archaeon]|nr:cell division protein SepF [Nanoarchaeota archaeon]